MVFTAKCHGPAPFGVGTMTAMLPDECHHCAYHTDGMWHQTEEREVIVQKNNCPQIANVKMMKVVTFSLSGYHSLPYSAQCCFYLIIYRQLLQQIVQQNKHGSTNPCHQITCWQRVWILDPCWYLCDGKFHEYRDLRKECSPVTIITNSESIWHALWPLCPMPWRKRCCRIFSTLPQQANSPDTRVWSDLLRTTKYRVNAENRSAWAFTHGFQCLLPSPSSKHLSQYAKWKRQQHPRPVHLVHHHVLDAMEVQILCTSI